MIILAFFLIIPIISSWKIYEKAGFNGWSALVPLHNVVKFFEIAGKPGWWIFLYLVPILNIVVYVVTLMELSKKFGQSTGFALGLLFFPYVFFPILAFGKYEYIKGNL
ncbi:MAG: DUF5684 domain-containing protein [Candidatus Gastranaerophilales bacterium]